MIRKALESGLIAIALILAPKSFAAEPIKLGLIEPLSGAFAYQGNTSVHQFEMMIDEVNARGGVLGGKKLALVFFDNKASPQESLLALKRAMDQGIRVVLQSSGSQYAHALSGGDDR